MIVERVEDKNPSEIDGQTPLHFAAGNGHLNICNLIIEIVQDKNPATALLEDIHHFNVLQKMVVWLFTSSLLREKRTKILLGTNVRTPLHSAARNG